MTAILIFFGVTLIVGYGILAAVPRWGRLAAFGGLLWAAGAMIALALGAPRPSLLIMHPIAGTLTAVALDEGRAIYLWVTPDGRRMPVSLAMPWSAQHAAQLEGAEAESRHSGRPVRVRVRGGAADVFGNGDVRRGDSEHGGGDSLPDDGQLSVEVTPPPQVQEKGGQ